MLTFFTSITFSYLNRARILVRTVKSYHPNAHFIVCISDLPPPDFQFNQSDELFDEVVWLTDLQIPNLSGWIFMHDIVELCTAVKGPVLLKIAQQRGGKIIYLDPDIALFGSLDSVISLLDTYDIVLTPHQLSPEKIKYAVIDNEICSLQHGVFNLGFVAINAQNEGLQFAHWWNDRLIDFCYDDIPNGLFVDQKWCDMAPCFYKNLHILRDPGYNVASWNISNRELSMSHNGRLLVNDHFELVFYHFTKAGPIGDQMTEKYAKGNILIFEIWKWYKNELTKNTSAFIPKGYWHYRSFTNGVDISKDQRILYRQRKDLRLAFPDPFDAEIEQNYLLWFDQNAL